MTDNSVSSADELTRLREKVSGALVKAPVTEAEMAHQALAVAVKPEFVKQIDVVVGDPLEGETREQYVDRGTKAIAALLADILIAPSKA